MKVDSAGTQMFPQRGSAPDHDKAIPWGFLHGVWQNGFKEPWPFRGWLSVQKGLSQDPRLWGSSSWCWDFLSKTGENIEHLEPPSLLQWLGLQRPHKSTHKKKDFLTSRWIFVPELFYIVLFIYLLYYFIYLFLLFSLFGDLIKDYFHPDLSSALGKYFFFPVQNHTSCWIILYSPQGCRLKILQTLISSSFNLH